MAPPGHTETQELVVDIDDYEIEYTWGDGAKEYFLNFLEIHARGKFYAADGEAHPATILFTTKGGEEPEPYDKDWFVPGGPLGKIQFKTVFQLQAAIARGGMRSMIQILRLNKPKMLRIVCSNFEQDGFGTQSAELIRFTLGTNSH